MSAPLALEPAASRKPRAGPIVEPSEAVAIGLSIALERDFSAHSKPVWLVLKSLHDAGYKIEPR